MTDQLLSINGEQTLSIVSKMVLAAARPEAKASRQGDAWPRFIAAMSTPKKTWTKVAAAVVINPLYLKVLPEVVLIIDLRFNYRQT